MKFKLISSRNAAEFERIVNEFISENEISKITYDTVSDNGFVIFVAYIEY